MQLIMTVKQRQDGRTPPIKVHVEVDKVSIPMEVDTAASVSIMSENQYHKLWRGWILKYIILLSDWLSKIRLNWDKIHYMTSPGLHELLSKYDELFQEHLGTFKDYKAKIEVDPGVTPRFCKARMVPYAMREKVEEELDRLVAEGTLEPVDYSDWAAPIVAVMKNDHKSVCVYGDFWMTVHPVSKLNRYPIPKTEDIFATLKRGKLFTKLDLSQVYLQLKLEESLSKYVVINTHKGLFRCTRLPYGISSAPRIFQKAMEQLLRGIPHVTVYIDDIFITAETEAKH